MVVQMSKAKEKRAKKASLDTNDASGPLETLLSKDDNLNENSFEDLKGKISAQLKKIDSKPGKGKKVAVPAQNKKTELARGKKRTADGNVVVERRATANKNVNAVNSQDTEQDTEQELRNALKDLGGTQEDLDLINDADSESELEGLDGEPIEKSNVKKKSSSLHDGMANILKEIALARGDQNGNESGSEEDSGIEEDEEENQPGSKGANSSKKQDQPAAVADKSISRRGVDSRLKCEPRVDWFNICPSEIDIDGEPKHKISQQSVGELLSYGKSLLSAENEAFKSTQQSSSSQAFYNTVIASGTLSDKVSALTLAVQESPLHNVKALENLINLAGKRSRAQAVDVLRALKDLLAQGSLLPGTRRLYTFASQPALNPLLGQTKTWKRGDKLPRGLQESYLICWAFEDWLKQQYFEILKILEIWCNDEIEFSKGRAISFVFELLKEKPEQESNLLRLLVNKLGDPVKKIASQTSYLLMQLLSAHPAMKMIVISAIEAEFIFRPGQSMHGKYYAVVTLNQTALSTREEDVAKKLLDIYFGLFTTILKPVDNDVDKSTEIRSQSRAQRQRKKKKKQEPVNLQAEELREKLVSAVLTGVNRAYPYVGTDQKNFTDHLETLFRITHSANFNSSIQAMLLIQQLTTTHSASADRFYRTLYESLLDPRLINASKQQLYLNLLHRSLKADMNIKRVKAFVKRLLQVLSLHDPSFICGVFFLLKDLEQTYPSLTALVDQAEDHDDDEETFRDVDEDATTENAAPTDLDARKNRYDGHKRAPEHANADNSCAWEILPFLAHYHPSVTVSADHHLEHSKLPGKPDLTLHTLIHFLDRFVYRNPKLAANKLRGSSIMQPMANDDTHAVLINSASRQRLLAVNTDEFRNKKDGEVDADDVFFHKYFTTLGKETKAKKRKDHDVDEEGSVGDGGEDAVWKAMMDSAPDLEGEGSEDDDLDMDTDMSDFEAEMNGDDSFSETSDVEFKDEGGEVDIEAGIFDDSDDDLLDVEVASPAAEQDSESDFEGLDSDAKEDPKAKVKKQKRKAEKDKRKKMKALPTFASAADYAKMLDEDEDEDLG